MQSRDTGHRPARWARRAGDQRVGNGTGIAPEAVDAGEGLGAAFLSRYAVAEEIERGRAGTVSAQPAAAAEAHFSVARLDNRPLSPAEAGAAAPAGYLISVSSLNIGMYIERMITPTMIPTPIIMIGSMIEVSVWIDASTSSS